MKKKSNLINRLTVISFFIVIIIFSLLQPLTKDSKLSVIERRRLEQFPQLTASSLISDQWVGALETYLLDQFPMRESFKNIDAFVKQVVFRNGDVDGFYNSENYLSKIMYPLNEQDVIHNANKITEINNRFLSHLNVYITVVPDKGYFTAKTDGHPSVDYTKMLDLFRSHLAKSINYIDIFPLLSIEDYYLTDAHWRQEKIVPVAKKIADQMSIEIPTYDSYTVNTFSPFKGVYYGRSANAFQTESLHYLSNDVMNHMSVTYSDKVANQMIYNPDYLTHLDAYDVFLGGPQPIVYIDNSSASTNRELVVFRDSFGSSITPLLLSNYSKITLIDLRYIDASQLEQYITFTHQDILFIYNTNVLNNRINFK
ncbi:DHHW family protein [Fusibacter bizertensis]